MTTTDLSSTIVPKSDQLNADDLIGGKTLDIEITGIKILAGDQPVALNYRGDNGKPYKPGKSMRRVLVHAWGSDGNKYIGRWMRLYNDPNITFGKDKVGGIRISHMSHIQGDMTVPLTATKGVRKPFTVKPMTPPSHPGGSGGSSSPNKTSTGTATAGNHPGGSGGGGTPPPTPFAIFGGDGTLIRYVENIGVYREWFKGNLGKFDTIEKVDKIFKANGSTFDKLRENYADEIQEINNLFFDLREELQRPSDEEITAGDPEADRPE